MMWKVRSSNVMLIVGMTLIVTSFILVVFFFKYISFNPADRLAMWLTIIFIVLVFELGFFSVLAVKIKEAVEVFVAIFIWSLVFFVPVPAGYEEVCYGGWGILLLTIIALYAKLKERKRNNQKNA